MFLQITEQKKFQLKDVVNVKGRKCLKMKEVASRG